MTFLELYDDQLDIELGTTDQTQLFTTARRKAAANAAMQAFVRQTGATKKYGEIAIVDGTSEYNLYTNFTDFIRLAGNPSVKKTDSDSVVTYIQGKDLPRRHPEQLDLLEPGWRSADAGTPAVWYLRANTGTRLIGLTPAPDVPSGDTWKFIVPYVAKPVAMSAGADVPFTVGTGVLIDLEPWHQALVHYAASVLEPLRKNTSGAERQMGVYAGYVAQFLQQEGQDSEDQIMLLRDYYSEAHRKTRLVDHTRWP